MAVLEFVLVALITGVIIIDFLHIPAMKYLYDVGFQTKINVICVDVD